MGWLPWEDALVAAIVLLVIGVLWRPGGRRGRTAVAFAREAALVLGLYAVWILSGRLSLMQVDGARARAISISRIEGALGLPGEVDVQALVIGHDWVIRASNLYYAWMHVPMLIVFLAWLFLRHRDQYPAWRTSLALLTAACVAIQLIPVAPPRMFGQLGLVDTGNAFGQSVYGPLGSAGPGQLSAMPSIHVAWAVLIGWAAVVVSSHPLRWWGVAHAVLTFLVVVVTANHWWLDGVVAFVLLAAIRLALPGAYALAAAVRGLLGRPAAGPAVALMPREPSP